LLSITAHLTAHVQGSGANYKKRKRKKERKGKRRKKKEKEEMEKERRKKKGRKVDGSTPSGHCFCLAFCRSTPALIAPNL
jgi:hypothetical protein